MFRFTAAQCYRGGYRLALTSNMRGENPQKLSNRISVPVHINTLCIIIVRSGYSTVTGYNNTIYMVRHIRAMLRARRAGQRVDCVDVNQYCYYLLRRVLNNI